MLDRKYTPFGMCVCVCVCDTKMPKDNVEEERMLFVCCKCWLVLYFCIVLRCDSQSIISTRLTMECVCVTKAGEMIDDMSSINRSKKARVMVVVGFLFFLRSLFLSVCMSCCFC